MFIENFSEIELITDPGIYFEINDFFSTIKDIVDFNVEVDEKI